ncbi:tail fiber protein [Lactobacillus phage SA-C12]|uniref:Tail fiber protein n=1 Tax=Lactobacillus phage SA-C12 TaxID=1755697 RepID=A0A1I9KK49_9CAUD|nr:tail fiber protein [Lactobacillus phage SA-C12]ALY06833.1 tail fiber protein [Lactobacillus phage SA-C12]
MTKSAFVEVNITNPTKLAQDSQDTANTAVKGVTDLNDPNLMSVIEKQNNVVQFAGLTSQYNVIVQNAKDEGINTDSLITAYNNLNKFMIDVLTDPDHASDVDRKTYKNYQDAYNSELAKIQTALKNNTDGKFTSAASATSQAASMANAAKSAADSNYNYANSEIAVQSTATAKAQSTADNAFSQAQAVGSQASAEIAINSQATAKAQSTANNAYSYANSQMAVNSQATAKAQSTADNAFSQAQAVGSQASAEISNNSTATTKAQSTADNAFSQATTAIDTGKVTSQAVTDLKDGSKLTIAELENGLATKVANSDYASYKVQTASQIAQKVDNGAFSAYQTTTADLIAQKVATKDFSAYQATTAKEISSKVDNGDFNTYKSQTADLIDNKVSSSEYASDKTQTASQIADRVSNSAFSTYQTQTASQIASKVDNGDFETYQTQTSKLIESKVDNGTYQTDKTQTAKDIASKVSSSDFSTYQTQTADLIDSKVSNSAYASDKQQTASQISERVANSDFETYKTQTAGLIAQKVATSDFSAYQATTAKSIESKVESSDFNTYKTQTADLIDDKVSNSAYASDKTQTASEIADRVSNSAFSTYQTQTASQIASKVDNGDFSTYKTQTAGLIAQKVATSDFSAYQATTAKEISSKVESSDFNTYKTQTADAISSKVESSDFQTLQTQVDNSVVGTNLLTNSNFSDESLTYWTVDPGTTTSFDSSGNLVLAVKAASGNRIYYSASQTLIAGTTYTISFYAYVDSSSTSSSINVKVGPYDNLTSISVSGNTLTRYTGIIKPVWGNSGTLSITVGAFNSGTVGDIVHITRIKLEKGSVATDWSLNPEDQATQSQITQLSGDINLRVTKGDLVDQINIQAGKTLISSSGQLTLSGKSVFLDSVDPVIMKSANIDKLLVGKKLTAADIAANTFTTNNGTFTVDSNGLVTATSLIIRGSTNLVYNSALSGGNGTYIPGWVIGSMGYYSNFTLHDGVPSVGFNNSTGSGNWVNFGQTKRVPLNGLTGQPYSASVWFIDAGSDATMTYQMTLAFYDANGNRLPAGNYTSVNLHGTGSAQAWQYLTIDGFNAPSTASSVGLQYWAYNGKGHALFSSPMLTQTAHSTGYQPDTGNVVSAGTILGTNISASTINGTTFHGGDIINDANNASQFYPTTISSNGHIYTTMFNAADAMQTDLSTGSLTTKYRATNSSSNQYEAYDTNISANQIVLSAGHTNGKDMSFSQSVTGSNQDGYVLISPLDGLTFKGDNQQITFSGTSADVTPKGIIITPYGNINPNGTQNIWYVGNGPTMKTASFGIDGSGANNIKFNRSLDIGNFNINTYHTITSSDNGPIHFNRNDGSSGDIYAATVHYTSLVKSSLLSVKRDVKKADTAYWAQLVNSIDLATYQYKTDDNTSHLRLSSIVDDVNVTKQWQLPDVFVARDENGKLVGVDDSVLLNATLATVQEQQKEIDQLNGHNMELEAKLNKLEAKLNG